MQLPVICDNGNDTTNWSARPMPSLITYLDITRQIHAVYRIDYNDTCVYIGTSPLHDITELRDARRNSEWQRLMKRNDRVTFHILSLHNTAHDAAHACSMAVIAAAPHCNLNGTTTPEPVGGAGKRLRDIDSGQVYASATVLARELGVTRPAVSNHLRGKNHTVAGRRFERI